jgi:hypothetical protein
MLLHNLLNSKSTKTETENGISKTIDDVEFRFKFALHTGTESPEVRDIIRNIQQFVGTLPQKIANRLKENTKGRTEKEIYTATL